MMLEKWKQRAIKTDLRKAAVIFLVTGFVLTVACSAAMYSNFRGRILEWEQLAETDGDSGREEKEHDREHEADSGDRERDGDLKHKEREGRDWEDLLKGLHLSAGDLALIACCGITGMVLGVWYCLLVLAWTYKKARRMGVNAVLWVLAALIFNLAAVAALYAYALLKGTCTNCGMVKSGGKFCGRCGSLLKKECPQCGKETGPSAAYCANCGKKLEEIAE